jgi:hypothetical protein
MKGETRLGQIDGAGKHEQENQQKEAPYPLKKH